MREIDDSKFLSSKMKFDYRVHPDISFIMNQNPVKTVASENAVPTAIQQMEVEVVEENLNVLGKKIDSLPFVTLSAEHFDFERIAKAFITTSIFRLNHPHDFVIIAHRIVT
ncbi:hypothetical protein F2Q70_00007476 [Brassica cretica]|uniref:Uncharacterized protein n=1 Tax=Brassica cretica TaxID=69181 RepID=A0A8S9M0F2_BRACR|nr:hypothetical protein F2Q70_00007476 [Brassica cretica]